MSEKKDPWDSGSGIEELVMEFPGYGPARVMVSRVRKGEFLDAFQRMAEAGRKAWAAASSPIASAMERLKTETTAKVWEKALEEVSGDRGPCEVEPIIAHGFGCVWVDRGRVSEFRRLWNAAPGQTPDLLKRLERCRAELDQSRTELRKSEAEWNTCFAELVKTRAACDRARDTLNVIEMTLRIGE